MDKEQQRLFEHARKRVVQKKRVILHFVLFLVGAIFLILINGVLGIGSQLQFMGVDWFVFAILLWAFVFSFHGVNVWVLHPFMGADWEEKQLEALVAKQKERIEKLQAQVDRDYPIPKSGNPPETTAHLPGSADEVPPLL